MKLQGSERTTPPNLKLKVTSFTMLTQFYYVFFSWFRKERRLQTDYWRWKNVFLDTGIYCVCLHFKILDSQLGWLDFGLKWEISAPDPQSLGGIFMLLTNKRRHKDYFSLREDEITCDAGGTNTWESSQLPVAFWRLQGSDWQFFCNQTKWKINHEIAAFS